MPDVEFCIVPIPFPHSCCSDELCFLPLLPYCVKPPNCNQSEFLLFDLPGVKPFSLEFGNMPYEL